MELYVNKEFIKGLALAKGSKNPQAPQMDSADLPACACRLQPYESVIWDIETLHFTTPVDPSSIAFLGTT